MVINKAHPVAAGLADADWPELLGYNKLLPKDDAQVIAEIDGDPLIVLGEYGLGRVCAYATDCAPHWSPLEFCLWSGYPALWQNIVNWLKHRE